MQNEIRRNEVRQIVLVTMMMTTTMMVVMMTTTTMMMMMIMIMMIIMMMIIDNVYIAPFYGLHKFTALYNIHRHFNVKREKYQR